MAALALLIADDRRAAVDVSQPPWNAIVKVQTDFARSCTGALVATDLVLTAAHCLYNHRTQRMHGPDALHVLVGYERGDYASHRTVARFVAGSDRPGSLAGDWALLVLAPGGEGGARIAPLALAATPPSAGEPVVMAGFSQDRRHLLLADQNCRVSATQPLLRHDCAGIFGTSGAPLLSRRQGRWVIEGVSVAQAADGTKLAVPVDSFRDAMARLARP